MSVPGSWVEEKRLRVQNCLMAVKLDLGTPDELSHDVGLTVSQSAPSRELRWKRAMGLDAAVAEMWVEDLIRDLVARINNAVSVETSHRMSSSSEAEAIFHAACRTVCNHYRHCRANGERLGAPTSSSAASVSSFGASLSSYATPVLSSGASSSTPVLPVKDFTTPQTASPGHHRDANHKGKRRAKYTAIDKKNATMAPNTTSGKQNTPSTLKTKQQKGRPNTPEDREAHWDDFTYRYDEEAPNEPGDLYKAMMKAMGETSGRIANTKKGKKKAKFGEDFIAPNGHNITAPMDGADISAMISELMADIKVTDLADAKLKKEAADVVGQSRKDSQSGPSGAQATSTKSSTSSNNSDCGFSELVDRLFEAAIDTSSEEGNTPDQQSFSSAAVEHDLAARLATLSTGSSNVDDKTNADAPAIVLTPASPTSSPDDNAPELGVAKMQTITKVGGGKIPTGEGISDAFTLKNLREVLASSDDPVVKSFLAESITIGDTSVDQSAVNENKSSTKPADSAPVSRKTAKKAAKKAFKQANSTTSANTSGKASKLGAGAAAKSSKSAGKAPQSISSTAAGPSFGGPSNARPDEKEFGELVVDDMTDSHKDITDMDELIRIAKQYMDPF